MTTLPYEIKGEFHNKDGVRFWFGPADDLWELLGIDGDTWPYRLYSDTWGAQQVALVRIGETGVVVHTKRGNAWVTELWNVTGLIHFN